MIIFRFAASSKRCNASLTIGTLTAAAILVIGVGGRLRAQTASSATQNPISPALTRPVSTTATAYAQRRESTIVLDSFDSVSQWTTAAATGVEIGIHPDSNGAERRAMRLDFDFHGHGGYAVVHRALNMTLPPNYEFSFAIRGDAPINTLEFKLVDSNGATWWSNNQNFQFPHDWLKITRKKRQISYAWGPKTDINPKRLAAIEFAITAGSVVAASYTPIRAHETLRQRG